MYIVWTIRDCASRKLSKSFDYIGAEICSLQKNGSCKMNIIGFSRRVIRNLSFGSSCFHDSSFSLYTVVQATAVISSALVDPCDVLTFIEKLLDAVSALETVAVDASGEADANTGGLLLENFFQMPWRSCPLINGGSGQFLLLCLQPP